MGTVRDGLKQDNLEKDTYDRLVRLSCDRNLTFRSDPDDIGSVRYCIDCGSEWREVRETPCGAARRRARRH